jgi:hypothetical protein
MKKLILIVSVLIFLFACEKNSDTGINLTTVDGWSTIAFKANYTIQVPDGFEGTGMSGFEGNTFSKYSADYTINLYYGYCSDLFCSDFGDSLGNSVPKSVQVRISSGALITLDKREFFYQNSETVGILYYSGNDISRGRLFWKDSGTLKAALEIDFNLSEIETVNKIIGSIKIKQINP